MMNDNEFYCGFCEKNEENFYYYQKSHKIGINYTINW